MRSSLRLADLRGRERISSRLMNVKIPLDVSDAIDKVAKDLAVSKTDVVIALLNEGMTVAARSVKGLQAAKAAAKSAR